MESRFRILSCPRLDHNADVRVSTQACVTAAQYHSQYYTSYFNAPSRSVMFSLWPILVLYIVHNFKIIEIQHTIICQTILLSIDNTYTTRMSSANFNSAIPEIG